VVGPGAAPGEPREPAGKVTDVESRVSNSPDGPAYWTRVRCGWDSRRLTAVAASAVMRGRVTR